MGKSLSILCAVLAFATPSRGGVDSDLAAVIAEREANLTAIEQQTEALHKAGLIEAKAVFAAKANRLRFVRDKADGLNVKILWQEELVKVAKQWYDMELARAQGSGSSLDALELKEAHLAEQQRLLEMKKQLNPGKDVFVD